MRSACSGQLQRAAESETRSPRSRIMLIAVAVCLLAGMLMLSGCDLILGAAGLRTLDRDITIATRLRSGTYTVTKAINVTADLVLDPGVTLRFESSTGMRITEFGSITAIGTADKPILFTSVSGNASDWQGLGIRTNESSLNTLAYVVIENAGQYHMSLTDGRYTNLFVDENARVSIVNCTFRRARVGVYFHGRATIVAFSGNEFDGNTEATVRLVSNQLGSFGPGNVFATNAPQAARFVLVFPSEISTSQTWRKIDVPYRFVATAVQANYNKIIDNDARVTIEAGTTIHFDSMGIRVDFGALRAIGTAAEKITFTTVPGSTAGSWFGISINSNSATATHNNELRHVVVERAGQYHPGDAYTRSNLWVGPLGEVWVENSSFNGSSHVGIFRHLEGVFHDEGGNQATGNATNTVNLTLLN